MKILNQLLAAIIMVVTMMACQEELPELGSPLSVDELKFEITQNPDDPNMVILESLTPGVIPFWTHPMGRSIKVKDTVKIPFSGVYKFVYAVQSGGGYTAADTVTLNITTMNLSYVEDPLWEALTGGVGKSKTWLLDLNAEGVSKYFLGPMYFYGTDNGWQEECLVEDGDCWNWSPDWPGNMWVADVGDYGEMTFSLKGGAFLSANHKMVPSRGEESGTYFLDAANHTLTTTDATPLHSPNYEGCVDNWGSAQVFSLTEDYMQLGFLRKASCEGEAMLVFNYISKAYSDKWVPEDQPDPEPELPDGWLEDVTTIVDAELKWALSPETPFNWAGLDGNLLYNWPTIGSYPDSTGFDETIPPTYSQFSLTMNSLDNTVEYVDPSGNVSTGSFTLDDKGVYTFNGVTPSFDIGPTVDLYTTMENQWRLLKVEKGPAGEVTGIWVGALSPDKPEYMAYHLVLQQKQADPLKVWKDALAGKTFVPDVNWFVDWVGVGPDFTGGWTSSSTFGDDYSTNSWVWNLDVRNIAESAALTFSMEADQMKITVSQTLTTEHESSPDVWVTDDVNSSYSVTGNVDIDPDEKVLTIDVPLVDYAGSPARWLGSEGNAGGEWFFVSHGGSTLANIDTEGLWLGYTSGDTETTILHYIVQ